MVNKETKRSDDADCMTSTRKRLLHFLVGNYAASVNTPLSSLQSISTAQLRKVRSKLWRHSDDSITTRHTHSSIESCMLSVQTTKGLLVKFIFINRHQMKMIASDRSFCIHRLANYTPKKTRAEVDTDRQIARA